MINALLPCSFQLQPLLGWRLLFAGIVVHVMYLDLLCSFSLEQSLAIFK